MCDRSGGSWSTTHGTWGYQLELPVAPRQNRRVLRRNGFDDRDTTRAELDHARSLLALAGDDTGLAVQIGDMLQACKNGIPLPSLDTVAARVRAGVPANMPTTTGAYLTEWLAGRRGLSPNTVGPHLEVAAQRLPVVLASRTGAGWVAMRTYGFPGSETG
ncbi:hypothetical protein [Actinoplanes utahensis]|uniref:hypothetical protein n=1 Tax=Actinoplanes utahensis TaxID=1869 RepID=UPI00068EAB31|nr:hypothetical protein [Actinoplanes utahensis]